METHLPKTPQNKVKIRKKLKTNLRVVTQKIINQKKKKQRVIKKIKQIAEKNLGILQSQEIQQTKLQEIRQEDLQKVMD